MYRIKVAYGIVVSFNRTHSFLHCIKLDRKSYEFLAGLKMGTDMGNAICSYKR
jgi:hypothetical protein